MRLCRGQTAENGRGMRRIESKDNPLIRRLSRLAGERKFRRIQGEMVCEGEKMLRHVHEGSHLMALDVGGKLVSSEELAASFSDLALYGCSEISFIIGGPFGLSDIVRRKADKCISFGRITLTHQMIRLILIEQIYRAIKISRHEPYHL